MTGASLLAVTLIVAVALLVSAPPLAVPSPSTTVNVTVRAKVDGLSELFEYRYGLAQGLHRRGRCRSAVEVDHQGAAVGAAAECPDGDPTKRHITAADADLTGARALALNVQLIGRGAVRRERNRQRTTV